VRPALALGVLGASAPATLRFLEQMRAAGAGRPAIRTLVDINPELSPLRAAGSGAGAALAEAAGALRGAGAEVLALVSDEAHAYADLIERAGGLAVVDMIRSAAQAARETGATRVGVLGPRGSLRLYREYLAAQALGMVTLDSERQAAFVETLAAAEDADPGAQGEPIAAFVEALAEAGAEVVIAAAVTVPLALDGRRLSVPIIAPADLLARRCVAVCLGLEPAPTLRDAL